MIFGLLIVEIVLIKFKKQNYLFRAINDFRATKYFFT